MKYLIILMFLFSCSSTQNKKQSIKDRQADLYYSAGTTLLVQHKFSKAIVKLKKANQLKKDDTKILNNLGLAFLLKGYPKRAIVYLRKSIKVDPDNLDAKNNLAGLYFKRKQYKSSKRLYLKILKVIEYENQSKTYYNLALIEQKFNRTRSKVKYLKLSIKEDQSYCPSHYLLSIHFLKIHQYQKALKEAFMAGKGSCYEEAKPILLQARIFRLLNRQKEAYQKYNLVIARFPRTRESTIANNYINDLLEINPTLSENLMDNNRNKILSKISL